MGLLFFVIAIIAIVVGIKTLVSSLLGSLFRRSEPADSGEAVDAEVDVDIDVSIDL